MGNKIKQVCSDVKLYWNHPPAGRYMPYKEIASYAFGGIGAYFLITVIQQFTISINSFIIGNVIGISPEVLYIINIIAVISGFPSTAIRAHIIDNTRNKKGKYRPYLMSMGIPTCILAIAFIMVPYEHIESEMVKAGIVLFFNICFQFFYMFFFDSYENLILVLSPNTVERSDASSVKAIVYSIAPTITTAITPIAAKFLTNGSIADIRLYRVLFPIYAVIGILLSVVVYANTQEKIIQAKTHAVQIKFTDALRAVAKNKYFWIISFAGWLGFLEGSYGVILNWLYEYRNACSPEAFTIIGLIYGNASFWGMLLAPFAIRRYGKKKVLVFTNVLNILFIALIYPVIVLNPKHMIWIVLIFLFMNAVVGAFAHILNPSLNGDIRDYQQYITGERIDGMFSTVGLIGSVITLIMSGVIPAVYNFCGINEATLEANKGLITQTMLAMGKAQRDLTLYDVLYLDDVFKKVMFYLILLSVIGAFMNVLPYFFYDLSEVKQRGMVKVLKIRALFEDYGNNALSDAALVEAIDIIDEAKEFAPLEKVAENKKGVKARLQNATHKEIKQEMRRSREYNQNIDVSKIVIDELNKFSNPVTMAEYQTAKRIYEAGIDDLVNAKDDELANARKLPKNTDEEKQIRKKAIEIAKLRKSSKKNIIKKHNGKIEVFDASIFESLFETEDKLDEEIKNLYLELATAKKNKDKETATKLKENIKELKAQKNENSKKIKVATDKNSEYTRLAKPYTDAKKIVVQEENYKHLDEIKALYDEAKERKLEQERLDEEEAKRLEQEKKEYAAKLRKEKLEAKLSKKNK